MRLDKYLKVSRLIKRRTVANTACDAGRVLVNGRPARASYAVSEGDRLTLIFGNREICVEVVEVKETIDAKRANELYRVISDIRREETSSNSEFSDDIEESEKKVE